MFKILLIDHIYKTAKKLKSNFLLLYKLIFITANNTGSKYINIKLTRSKFKSLEKDLVYHIVKPHKKAFKNTVLVLISVSVLKTGK